MKAYQVEGHPHSAEINHVLHQISEASLTCHFVPHLIPITRGILSTLYVPLAGSNSAEQIWQTYRDFYQNAPFVRMCALGEFPEVRYVTFSNFCDIGIAVKNKTAVIVSVIDNLVKGAAGQAIQNMNIMFGRDETEGLMVCRGQ